MLSDHDDFVVSREESKAAEATPRPKRKTSTPSGGREFSEKLVARAREGDLPAITEGTEQAGDINSLLDKINESAGFKSFQEEYWKRMSEQEADMYPQIQQIYDEPIGAVTILQPQFFKMDGYRPQFDPKGFDGLGIVVETQSRLFPVSELDRRWERAEHALNEYNRICKASNLTPYQVELENYPRNPFAVRGRKRARERLRVKQEAAVINAEKNIAALASLPITTIRSYYDELGGQSEEEFSEIVGQMLNLRPKDRHHDKFLETLGDLTSDEYEQVARNISKAFNLKGLENHKFIVRHTKKGTIEKATREDIFVEDMRRNRQHALIVGEVVYLGADWREYCRRMLLNSKAASFITLNRFYLKEEFQSGDKDAYEDIAQAVADRLQTGYGFKYKIDVPNGEDRLVSMQASFNTYYDERGQVQQDGFPVKIRGEVKGSPKGDYVFGEQEKNPNVLVRFIHVDKALGDMNLAQCVTDDAIRGQIDHISTEQIAPVEHVFVIGNDGVVVQLEKGDHTVFDGVQAAHQLSKINEKIGSRAPDIFTQEEREKFKAMSKEDVAIYLREQIPTKGEVKAMNMEEMTYLPVFLPVDAQVALRQDIKDGKLLYMYKAEVAKELKSLGVGTTIAISIGPELARVTKEMGLTDGSHGTLAARELINEQIAQVRTSSKGKEDLAFERDSRNWRQNIQRLVNLTHSFQEAIKGRPEVGEQTAKISRIYHSWQKAWGSAAGMTKRIPTLYGKSIGNNLFSSLYPKPSFADGSGRPVGFPAMAEGAQLFAITANAVEEIETLEGVMNVAVAILQTKDPVIGAEVCDKLAQGAYEISYPELSQAA